MKKKAWIIVVTVMVLAAVLVFLFRKKIFPGLKQSGTATASGTDESSRTDRFPLQNGSSGERVAKLQAYINKMWKLTPVSRDHMPLAEDGIFGVKTTAACEMFLNTSSVSESWYNQYIK
ncbi:MAG: hypothetical protein NC324_02335 [Bacteroides sp.]|nr:hypothetical protein [Bacteroides sp.]